MPDARDLDLLAARALPGAEEERRAGWLLRSSPGEPKRRVNSALPLEPGVDPAVVEAWFGARGTVPHVLVSDAAPEPGLDAALDAAGWALDTPTDVLIAQPDAVLDALGGVAHAVVPGELDPAVRSADPVVPLVAALGAGRATCILQERTSLMVGLEVDDAARRRGVAAALVRAWARLAEGRTLFLQVGADNAPAQALYAAAGFSRSHGYHYRTRRA